jgi:hypothetical protein
MLAQYVDRGAEQIEQFGGYLHRRDTSQLVTDVEGFARRQPLAFAGGAFALGMLAVRFLRSKNQPRSQSLASPGPASHGSFAARTPSGAASTGAEMTPRPASTPPGGYTAAAQAALNRTPPPQTASTSRAGSDAGISMNPGTPAAPGPGTTAPGTQSERPTPRPVAAPPTTDTPAASGSTSQTPEPGGRTGGGTSTSDRTGAGSRNQP